MSLAGLTYSPLTKFPGRYALLPCLGAAACIYAGQSVVRGNFLQLKPIVYIGKASYSIYLIHWPLLVFYLYFVHREISALEKVALAVSSILLGAFIYEIFERRFSWKRLAQKKSGRIFGVLSVVFISVAVASLFFFVEKSKGLTWRVANEYVSNPVYTTWGGEGYEKKTILGKQGKEPFAVLTGDSFSVAYAEGFDKTLQQRGKSIAMNSELGCLLSRKYKVNVGRCNGLLEEVLNESDLPIIISQAWPAYIEKEITEGNKKFVLSTQDELMVLLRDNLDDLRSMVGNRKLILVGSTAYLRNKNKYLFKRPSYLMWDSASYIVDPSELIYYKSNEFLKEYAQAHENVYFIDITPITCPDNVCTEERTVMLYNDDYHLSKNGSKVVGEYVLNEVERLLETKE